MSEEDLNETVRVARVSSVPVSYPDGADVQLTVDAAGHLLTTAAGGGGGVVDQGLPAAPAGAWPIKLVDAAGVNVASVSAAGAVKVDGSAVTQPISAAALPLPTGAATEATLALVKAKTDNLDVALSTRSTEATLVTRASEATLATRASEATLALIKAKTDNLDVALSTRAVTGLTDAELRASAVPVSAASLPLPSGAATEATLATRATEATLALVKAKTDNLDVALSTRATEATLATRASEATLATLVADATVTARLNTLGQKAMAASAPVVIASDQSAVPVSAASLPLPTGAATEATLATRAAASQLPAALVGGRLDENVGAWLGSTAPTVGSKVSASSVPVVIASDQAALPLPTGAATAANQTTVGSQTTKVNDGTNTMAVKAASTAAVAADPAAVVSVSPNTPVSTKTALTSSSPTAASVGVASGAAVAANAARKGLILTNTSTFNISFGIGAAAVLNSGITLTPNGVWVMDEYSFTTGAINAIAGGAASNLAVQEFTT